MYNGNPEEKSITNVSTSLLLEYKVKVEKLKHDSEHQQTTML